MPRHRAASFASLAVMVVGAVAFAQRGSQATLQITSPAEGSFISGTITMRAELDPPTDAKSVVFFADGRQLCTVIATPFECTWDAGPTIVAHTVRVVATLTGDQRVIKAVRTKGVGFAEKVDVDIVQVTATVLDGRGHYVKGLQRSAFHVSEDDQPQTITHFASEDVPLELIVAVDVSGSMTAAMPKMKQAVKEFLGTVPARDRVTLIGFNDSVFTLTRNATNQADRVKAVDKLRAWGGTTLYDVILRSIDMLGRQVGRKAIVVFSDGEDEGSHAVLMDVEQRLQASDVTLYMIGQGRGVTMEPLKKVLDRLSKPTGGRAIFTDSIDELHDAFNDLLQELSQQYLLGYPPTKSVRDDTYRRIKVSVDGSYQVRARQGYRASPEK